MENKVNIEVAYAGISEQVLLSLEIAVGSTVLQAIKASDIEQRFPEIKELEDRVGIFGKKVSLETVLKAGDRVEIYRPLLRDPKEARRLRAKKMPLKKVRSK
jgi:putative ubiquitin-RnfH superfamily antitoxin RatB of RatAB toxin-antitoxin module